MSATPERRAPLLLLVAAVGAVVGGGLLVVALGARWTLFLAGLLPLLAGLSALALQARESPVANVSSA